MTRAFVVRFGLAQRLQHLSVMVLFVALVLTGFPQKFPDAPWAQGLVDVMGGLPRARFLHRAAGLAFAALALGHLGLAAARLLLRRQPLTLVPRRQDFRDVVANLRYYLGLAEAPPPFDRFDYREKFEYWGMAMGAVVMTLTGLVLLFPLRITHLVPGEVIPLAKVTHSNEGMLAFLVVVVWHIFNVHVAPEVFPFNTSIFTGRITVEQLRHHHALEYERLFGGAAAPPPPDRLARLPAAVLLLAAPALGLALVMFVPVAGFGALAVAAGAAFRKLFRGLRRGGAASRAEEKAQKQEALP